MVVQKVFSTKSFAQATRPPLIGGAMKVGIGGFAAWMLGVGSIIGSMAWLMHAPMLARAGPLACLSAWALAAVLTIPLCLILMELSSMFPSAGGPYVYKYYALKRLLPKSGELLGFLTGWIFWVAGIVGLACMGNGLTNLLAASVFGGAHQAPIWFGPLLILLLFSFTTGLNMLQVSRAAQVSNLFSLLKMSMAVGFICLVFAQADWSLTPLTSAASPAGNNNFFSNISSVLMLALAGFSFLEITACTSSETIDAKHAIPRAIMLSLLSVTVIYLSMCFAVSIAAPYELNFSGTALVVPETNIEANIPAIAGYVGGTGWGSLFSAGVVVSIVGCGFTALLGLARIGFSMAETGLFPKQFSRLSANNKVPAYALGFQFFAVVIIGSLANLLARTGCFPDAYSFLGNTFGFMYSFIAVIYGFCLLSLRYTDPQLPRPFRVGARGNSLAWILSIITALVWGYAALACVSLAEQVAGLLILLAGVPVYYYYKRIRDAALALKS